MDIDEIKRDLGALLIDALTQDELITQAYNLGHAKGFTEGVAKWAGDEAKKTAPAPAPEPELSRFLPKMPDDLPELPDGWVYVGMGRDGCGNTCSKYICGLSSYTRKWTSGAYGDDIGFHYAVRIDAPDEEEIWKRFGLMPYEHLFYSHTPGDPMPCGACDAVEYLDTSGRVEPVYMAYWVTWRLTTDGYEKIIGWRPADWLERREQVREQNNWRAGE